LSKYLQNLEDNRIPILLTEIGAYLHLLGRFSTEFIESQASDASENDKKFDYQKIFQNKNFFGNTGLDDLLKDKSWKDLINKFVNCKNLGELSSHQINDFCDFIENHEWGGKNPRGLCKILADAHGIISGIDKALAGRGGIGKQKKEDTVKSTAFGHENEVELNKNLKELLLKELNDVLEIIKEEKNVTYESYRKFITIIENYYPKAIGETRRPINEISLFDYAHAIASLTKSSLAKIIIDGWYEPKGKSKWRILKINVDVLGLLSKGLKIGDILGYKNELTQIFEGIKEIIEFKYPLGNEIYRDSSGIYFSYPSIKNQKDLENEIIERLNEYNKLDYNLQIGFSDDSRSLLNLGLERKLSHEKIVYHHKGNIEYLMESYENSKGKGKDTCPVCMIRLKDEKVDRCDNCKNRYEKRALDWLANPQETIWIDEVSDHNDCVALIVGYFDLDGWLSGKFIDTFVSQTFEDWRKENQKICDELVINSVENLINKFESIFAGDVFTDQFKNICKSFIGKKPNDFINDFWEPIAERDATGRAQNLVDNNEKARWLVKLLFRKHPSLSRISRIWKNTSEFIESNIFSNILANYDYAEAFKTSNLRKQRIQFKIDPLPKVWNGVTYDIDLDGIRLSPLWDGFCNTFVSTINLQILKTWGDSLEKIVSYMKEKVKKVKVKINGVWKNGNFTISEARSASDKFQDYLPYIRIYDSPDQFMIIVPAYDALDIVNKIIEDYKVQFSKVRDRLPLNVGIIAFHRKDPLYIAMDAGNKLIEAFKRKINSVNGNIDSIQEISNNNLGKYVKKINLQTDPTYSSVPLTWLISYSTRDPNQIDEWHPYLRLNGSNISRGSYSFDYDGNGHYVVHVKELQPADSISIESSYFKMMFLENAADRFKMEDGLRPIDEIERLNQVWRKIGEIMKLKDLGISQIYAYWQEGRKRYEDFEGDSIWENFVKSSLINILKVSPEQDKESFDRLFQATRDGLLDLCLDWNLRVRKIKPEIGGY